MIVSLLGILISLFAYLLAFPQAYQRRFDVYGALLALHIAAAIGFWLMSFESGMDAFLYYRDPEGFFQKDAFTSGTYFLVHVVQNIRHTLGGSFLDHFLFFQCFGMIGIALMIRCFNEVAESLGMSVPLVLYATLALPGLHLWTSGIGKDGIMSMAIVLALWSALSIHKRLPWLGLALVIMMVIRPHIASVVVAGLGSALLFSNYLPGRIRVMLAPVAMIGLIFVASRAGEKFGVTLDPDSFSSFVETQQGLGDKFGSGAGLEAQSLPLKVWALLFRPFFYDAEGMMGWLVSIENAVLMYFILYIVYHGKLLFRLAKSVFYVPYAVTFASILIFLLSLVNYNIGLGQRQKMMAVPAILMLYATISLYKRYLSARAGRQLNGMRAQEGMPSPRAPITA